MDLIFKSGWSQTRFRNSSGQSRIQIYREHVFGSQNNATDETDRFNNVVSCYKEAVQFRAYFVTTLFASF